MFHLLNSPRAIYSSVEFLIFDCILIFSSTVGVPVLWKCPCRSVKSVPVSLHSLRWFYASFEVAFWLQCSQYFGTALNHIPQLCVAHVGALISHRWPVYQAQPQVDCKFPAAFQKDRPGFSGPYLRNRQIFMALAFRQLVHLPPVSS